MDAYTHVTMREPYIKPAMAATEQSPARDMQTMAAIGHLVIAAAVSKLPPPLQTTSTATTPTEEAVGRMQEEAAMQLSPKATTARIGTVLNNTKFQTVGKTPSFGEQRTEGLNLLGHNVNHDNASTMSPSTPCPAESAADSSATAYATASSEVQGQSTNAINVMQMWPPTPPSKSEQNAAKSTVSEGSRDREDQGETGGQ